MVTWAANNRMQWEPMTVPKMKAFITVILAMGIVTLPRYKLYRSVKRILHHLFFPSVFSRNNFLRILRFYHLADNNRAPRNDKLAKVRPLLQLLIPQFAQVYTIFHVLVEIIPAIILQALVEVIPAIIHQITLIGDLKTVFPLLN